MVNEFSQHKIVEIIQYMFYTISGISYIIHTFELTKQICFAHLKE